MRDILLTGFAAAAIAGLIASLLVPGLARLALAFRAIDFPGGRREHGEAIPRLGGIAIAAGIFLGAGGVGLVRWGELAGEVARAEVLTFALATGMIFLLGLVDDLVKVSMGKKFLVQFAAAGLIVYAGWSFAVLKLPLVGVVELGVFGTIVSLVWIVGVTNAVNLLDGLDGLAGGVAAIVALGILVLALFRGDLLSVLMMAAVVGACVGFLRHNWAPARIFMGDSGALTLGFLLAVMSLQASMKSSAAVAILVPILALGLPVIDTLLVMAVRFLQAPTGPFALRLLQMFRADRRHLHHLLAHLRPNRKRIVVTIYALAVLFCAMALVAALTNHLALGLTLVGVQILLVLVIRQAGLRRAARALAAEKRRALREAAAGAAANPPAS